MKPFIIMLSVAGVLAGCAGNPAGKTAGAPDKAAIAETAPNPVSVSMTLADYKHDLARRIAAANAAKVYAGRPQALLRSVIVVKFMIDAKGNLIRSDIVRSNHDGVTEATALHSLRNTSPFPRPASHLLRRGQVEITETWLFNNDGRFQLRTIAEPQMDS